MDKDKLELSGALISKAILGATIRALAYSGQRFDNRIFIGLDGERLSAGELADSGPSCGHNVGEASNNDLGSEPVRQFHGQRSNLLLQEWVRSQLRQGQC